MLQNLKSHLVRLADFSGREGTTAFWSFAAFVIVADMAAMMAVMLPEIFGTFAKAQRFAIEHPDQVTITRGPGSYHMQIHGNHPDLMPDISAMFTAVAAIAAISVLLLGAAVARRLHDSDLSGAWGLMPLPFLAAGMILMPPLFADFSSAGDPSMKMFLAVFLNNLTYIGLLAALIVLLGRRGTVGENRFGVPPES
jgi:uncharacterized membrane protein YhaH (DUF805 family)